MIKLLQLLRRDCSIRSTESSESMTKSKLANLSIQFTMSETCTSMDSPSCIRLLKSFLETLNCSTRRLDSCRSLSLAIVHARQHDAPRSDVIIMVGLLGFPSYSL